MSTNKRITYLRLAFIPLLALVAASCQQPSVGPEGPTPSVEDPGDTAVAEPTTTTAEETTTTTAEETTTTAAEDPVEEPTTTTEAVAIPAPSTTVDTPAEWKWTDGNANETGPAGTNGVVPRNGWADSYSAVVDGVERCFIDSTFDHGVGVIVVNTPDGDKTVRQIFDDMGPGPGVGNNPVYNDIQCGNGPKNNAGDEDWDNCPGRVDMGAAGCGVIGPLWGLEIVYAD